MSGFFEDDFEGDVLSVNANEQDPEIELMQPHEEYGDAAPSAMKIINKLLSSTHKPKQIMSSKGFTPNNRYK